MSSLLDKGIKPWQAIAIMVLVASLFACFIFYVFSIPAPTKEVVCVNITPTAILTSELDEWGKIVECDPCLVGVSIPTQNIERASVVIDRYALDYFSGAPSYDDVWRDHLTSEGNIYYIAMNGKSTFMVSAMGYYPQTFSVNCTKFASSRFVCSCYVTYNLVKITNTFNGTIVKYYDRYDGKQWITILGYIRDINYQNNSIRIEVKKDILIDYTKSWTDRQKLTMQKAKEGYPISIVYWEYNDELLDIKECDYRWS